MPLPDLLRRALGRRPEFRARPGGRRPDIVLFMSDEHRHDEVGYASNGYYETPVLDALAWEGVVFENAYSGATVCIPARVSLLTGLEHNRVRHQPSSLALKEGYWTIARALKDIGYQTALVGKMHFTPMYAQHGFDRMLLSENLIPFSGYAPGEIDDYHRWLVWQGRADSAATHMFGTDPASREAAAAYDQNRSAVTFPYDKSFHCINWIAARAIELLKERRADVPLFLVVSFPRPHAPYDPAEPYASRYRVEDARLPADGFEVNEALPEEFREAFGDNGRRHHVPHPVSELPEPVFRRILTNVRALVRQMDDAIGEVLEHVDRTRTVLFFTADHGTYAGHRGLIGKVPWIGFDDLARVPLLCVAPGVKAGLRVRAPVQSSDFALTCLDYVDVEPPPGIFRTVSLRHVLEGGAAPQDRTVFTTANMIRKRNLKLLRRGAMGSELVFDLERDPGETTNVASVPAYAGPLAELRATLDAITAAEVVDL